jgi:hypothetical protein
VTSDERNKRWQEIFDSYDRAVAEFHGQLTLTQTVAPHFKAIAAHLDQLMAKWDEQLAAAKRVMDATIAANRAALALYRDEPRPEDR